MTTIEQGTAGGIDSNRATANTPPMLAGGNTFTADRALCEALDREGGGWAEAECVELGSLCGEEETIGWGFAANEHSPELRAYDRSGARVDELVFHPAHHRVMETAVRFGIHAAPWADERPGAHVARAAKFILLAQIEAGFTCPIAMTYSCVPALRVEPAVAALWEPLVTSAVYEPELAPPASKHGALIGMALTEKQGGSDVRTNTTVARPAGDGQWLVDGDKWFVSATQSDAFFVLAQTPGGLSCLLVPRLADDGECNGFRVDRLKEKLGNRSNPTAEVVLRGALASLVGEEGRGVQTIMKMIAGTRQDCVLGSTAVIRLGTSEAFAYARGRAVFGAPLLDQPAMRNVLADLAIESEAATISALRLARAHEEAHRPDAEAELFRRLAAPVLKYWICKRAPVHSAEALECQGGYGYVEESRLPRAYREAPLMSIWEGSGNVQALDVLRAMGRSPESVQAFMAEVEAGAGADRRLDAAIAALHAELARSDAPEHRARGLVGLMARTLQASLLVRHGEPAVADAYCASRLAGGFEGAFGALPTGLDLDTIIQRQEAN